MLARIVASILLLFTLSAGTAKAQINKWYFVWLSQDLVMENRSKEAIETLNILLRSDPNAYEGYYWRGIAKYNLDDLLGAEQDFTTAIEKNPVFTMAYQFRAITRAQLGNYDDALKDFREAIDLRPDRAGPYFSRGITYLLTQQYEKAVEDFDMFIRFNNKNADAYINRGMAYLHMKDTVAAHKDLDLAVRTNREYPRGYVQRGALYLTEGEHEKALTDFDKAIECDSTYLAAYFNRSLVYSELKKPSLALQDLDKVIDIDPTSSIAYFNRAIMRSQIGDYNRALEDYDKVAEYSPGNVIVYYNRGGLYYQLGELEKALDDYDKAIELYPDFANAYLNRAGVKYLMRDEKGSDNDRLFAELKIDEYRSKLNDSTFSIYADTSRKFNQLLSFDAKLSPNNFSKTSSREHDITLRPLYKFTIYHTPSDELAEVHRYYLPRMDEFIAEMDEELLVLSNKETNVGAEHLINMDNALDKKLSRNSSQWETLFKRGVTQSLIKQYTNAVTYYSAAIAANPSNPFLYFNRSTTRAEMTDFISSMDNSYNHLSFDSDPTSRLRSNSTRTYNYEEAIADLTKAAKLYPEMPHIYYNRGNLLALSDKLPEAFEDYSRAIGLYPEFADAYFNRGLVQIYMKDTRKGLLDISKAGELGIKDAYTVLKIYSDFDD